jgi:hypothetical protein
VIITTLITPPLLRLAFRQGSKKEAIVHTEAQNDE